MHISLIGIKLMDTMGNICPIYGRMINWCLSHSILGILFHNLS